MAVQNADQGAGQEVARARLRQERAGLARPERSRSDDQVGAPADPLEEKRQLLGMVRVVAVEEDENVRRVARERSDAGQAGAAVALSGLPHDAHGEARRDRRGAVGRAVVDDDDLVRETGWKGGDDERQGLALVEDGNDDRDAPPIGSHGVAAAGAGSRARRTATASPARISPPATSVFVVRLSPRIGIASAVAISGCRKT